jgi:polyhydroxyalkanoate synthesis regulator phasin
MSGDDLFKRYLEIGAAMLGMSREKAEGIVKDLVASGEVARGQATKAADWLVERGRAGTEELADLVRREVRQQVESLGLATKDDIARIEAKLGAATTTATPATAQAPTTTAAKPKKAAAKKRAAAATSPSTAGGGGGAGITRSASVRRRSGGSGASGPDPAPPAGGAVPPKG